MTKSHFDTGARILTLVVTLLQIIEKPQNLRQELLKNHDCKIFHEYMHLPSFMIGNFCIQNSFKAGTLLAMTSVDTSFWFE